MSGPIVLGYDGSDSANAALAATEALAPRLGAPVVVVFAFYISPLGGGDVRDYKHALEQTGSHALARAVSHLEAADVQVSTRMESGKPAQVIADVARELGASMIVVGTEARSPIRGAILGSVVLRLIQHSPVPVLVVPAEGAP